MTSPRTLARIAGGLYLAVAVFTSLAGLVNTGIVTPDDATATTRDIAESATLFRLAFAAELVGAVFFLLTGVALYRLLNHVGRLTAAVMVGFVAIGVAIQTLNLVNQQAALRIATGPGHAEAFGEAGTRQLTMLFADLQHDGYLIAQTYFGLWLLPLGYLVHRSGYFPKALGVLLVIGCLGHLTDVFTRFLAPEFGARISLFALTPAAIAELSFVAWLLVKGAKASTAVRSGTAHARS
ncbi:DUF4386 domain-containing protein [Stackebrandtia nassauensis]|uniref:DUF4386 domain-containing protein n=1 Tax=Stackebrandtia nassauensis (strain DSM 44728 / CIP 108903 / NRRL B-16338 / NBRC 102104 / LLR-40K-21) TaxID=446470 RepID=D3Q0V4_STANL|nr:DUF4386 domain-containing protein [Stackebrandtia nassauensis]ADD43704.1 conserved hypothetical protein [Stackebrandtia nassauensis DSM 44728]